MKKSHLMSALATLMLSLPYTADAQEQADTTQRADTTKYAKCGRRLGDHLATYYKTEGSTVHRPHPTAAYNFAPKGTILVVTNLRNNKSCVVEVTDRMGNRRKNIIDLSHSAFGMIADHGTGVIKVSIKTLD